jgi:hypothetical protein
MCAPSGRRVAAQLAKKSLEQHCVERIAKVFDQYASFLAPEPGLVSLVRLGLLHTPRA